MRRFLTALVVLALITTTLCVPLSASAATTYVVARPPAKVVSYARTVAKKGWKVWYPARLPSGYSIESVRILTLEKSATANAGSACLVTVKKGTQRVWIWNGPREVRTGLSAGTIPWGPYTARIWQTLAAIRATSVTSHSVRVNTNVTQLKVIAKSMSVVR